MADDGRVVTAKLPDDLVSRMDEIAARMDRSKSGRATALRADIGGDEVRGRGSIFHPGGN